MSGVRRASGPGIAKAKTKTKPHSSYSLFFWLVPAQNVFKIMGSVIELLSVTKDGCYRFKYHGLLKHKHGMECWCKQLLEESGVTVSGVRFEPGPREYDQEDVGSNVS